MTEKRCIAILLFVAACFGFAASAAWAEAIAPQPLPPQAQEALDKGIAAAKVPNYLQAIKYFNNARKLAPGAPVVLMNLGIAESKVPGRELRAIAWFGAYLNANPATPNAAAIKAQITALDERNRTNTQKFVEALKTAADKLENAPDPLAEQQMVQVLTDAGDVAGALHRADLFSNDPQKKSGLQSSIAEAQAMRFDVAGALKTAELIDGRDKEVTKGIVAKYSALIAKQGEVAAPAKRLTLYNASMSLFLGSAYPDTHLPKLYARRNTTPPTDWWLVVLDDTDEANDCALNTKLFLNLDRHLKSVLQEPYEPGPSTSPSESQSSFLAFADTAERLIKARNVVVDMWKQQLKR